MKKVLMIAALALALLAFMPSVGAATTFDAVFESGRYTNPPHTDGEQWADPCKEYVQITSATWTCTAGTNIYYLRLTNTDDVITFLVPYNVPSTTTTGKGTYVTGFVAYYDWSATGSLGITFTLLELTYPADGSQMTGASKAMTSDHTYLQRIAGDEQTVTYTVTSPSWTSTGVTYVLKVDVDGDNSAQFDWWGLRWKFSRNWH